MSWRKRFVTARSDAAGIHVSMNLKFANRTSVIASCSCRKCSFSMVKQASHCAERSRHTIVKTAKELVPCTCCRHDKSKVVRGRVGLILWKDLLRPTHVCNENRAMQELPESDSEIRISRRLESCPVIHVVKPKIEIALGMHLILRLTSATAAKLCYNWPAPLFETKIILTASHDLTQLTTSHRGP